MNRSGIWPLKAPDWQRAALIEQQAFEVRRPITRANTTMQRGDFGDVDFDTAHAIGFEMGTLRARLVLAGGGRRSIWVKSRVQQGDLFWFAGGGLTRAQGPSLWVRYIRAERLLSASPAAVAAAAPAGGASVLDTYNDVVESMTASARRGWLRTEYHALAMGPSGSGATMREVFLARWVAEYGLASLFRNPWTWVYGVRLAPVAVEAARSLAKSGALAQVCGAAPYTATSANVAQRL
jgi:hypothetical protein